MHNHILRIALNNAPPPVPSALLIAISAGLLRWLSFCDTEMIVAVGSALRKVLTCVIRNCCSEVLGQNHSRFVLKRLAGGACPPSPPSARRL